MSADDPMYQNMIKYMGKETLDSSQDIEDGLMSGNATRMRQLMAKMISGELTAENQQEMLKLMQDPKIAAGSAMMMSNMMSSKMMSVAQTDSQKGVQDRMHKTWAVHWITVGLLWAALILCIAALVKYLKK